MAPSLDTLFASLRRLTDGKTYSRETFDIAEEGFNWLTKLLSDLSREVSEVQRIPPEPEPLNETELKYASQATNSAACAAVEAAKAANFAARVSTTAPQELAARRAIQGALLAAGAAHRAAGAAQDAARAALSLPPGAQLPYDPQILHAILGETERYGCIYRFLFDGSELGLQHSLFSTFSQLGQMELAGTASSLWDTLLQTLQTFDDPEVEDPLAKLLSVLRDSNQKLQAQLRQHALSSRALRDPSVLEALENGDDASAVGKLGFSEDAKLRARNMQKKPELFNDGIAGDEDVGDFSDYTVASGKYGKENVEFLSFPGKINGKAVKPLIDMGAGCNLVRAEWLRENGIGYQLDLAKCYKILMADGSTSKDCPCVSVDWTFDDRKTVWKDTDFVVVEGYRYDALIGLPFLRVTETIHNSLGRLVFPEFRGIHAEKRAIPIFNIDNAVKMSTGTLDA